MKKLLCLFVIVPVLAFSQTQNKYSTLLWKITGKGLKKPSYLYGTMHVSNRAAYYLSEEFFEALKSVDVVGLETNPGEWMENMEKTGELSESNNFSSVNYYNRSFYKQSFANKFPEKKLLESILSYDHNIINGLLYRQNSEQENFEENTYIDLFIFQSASKQNKPVINLEDFAQSEIYAKLSALPDEEEEDESESVNYRNYSGIVQKIEDAYRAGDLSQLDSLSKLTSSKNMVKYLINARNVVFTNTIDSVLKTKTLFSGVGAAHLPGEKGVIELLREKGYTVESVQPSFTKKSIQQRENLEVQVKPVNFQKYTIPDSSFTVQVPGKLYHITSVDNFKYYLFADMVNGSFYSVARLTYPGPLFQVNAEQMMKKIDELLFEHIPGKILSKKEITANNGMKGIEIINKTRSGDQQRYHIYISDLEMIIFKLGAKTDYASSSEAKQFFNSISFQQKKSQWQNFSPTNKGFSAKIPADFYYEKYKGGALIGLVEDLFAYDKATNSMVGMKHVVYNDFNYLEEDTFELNQFAKNILVNYEYTVSPVYKLTKEQGLPCIQFQAKNKKENTFFAKVYIKGVHYYFIYSVAGANDSFENDFFKSFKLEEFKYTNPSKLITDRDFYFKAIDELTDDASSRFNEAYAKAYASVNTKKESQINAFDARIDNKYYYSPSSGECVSINMDKYNDYDFRELKDMEERIVKRYKATSTLIVKRKHLVLDKDKYRIEFILKDTATSRAIDSRIFIKNGVLLEINAPFDTLIGLQGWAKSFVESFEPMDTVIGKSIFENRFKQLTEDLSSNDTLKRRMANTSMKGSITLQKAFVDEFVTFLGDKKLQQVSEESRAQLFVNGGALESDKIIAPYKELYKQYTDSFYLQLCLLKGLAYHKTQKSFDAFYELVMNETPLVGSDVTINDVFSSLHDSIELCKKYFPGILPMTKYDEYRDAIYSLMAALVNKKLLLPGAYTMMKEGILIDANLCLKRFSPSQLQRTDQKSFSSLDKNSKDLAENLQYSLESLSNNMIHKGSNYLRILDAYNRHPLVNYAIALAPFYQSDPKAKHFFDHLSKIKQQQIAMPVYIQLMKQGVVLNDTLGEYYCKNKYTRAFYYTELEKENLVNKFNKKYATQKNLVESFLMSQRQLSGFYNYEKEKAAKDSLVFIKEFVAHNKYQNGHLFLYKNNKSQKEDIKWSAVFVDDTKGLNSKMEIVSMDYFIDTDKSDLENENELLEYFYCGFRKRAMIAEAE